MHRLSYTSRLGDNRVARPHCAAAAPFHTHPIQPSPRAGEAGTSLLKRCTASRPDAHPQMEHFRSDRAGRAHFMPLCGLAVHTLSRRGPRDHGPARA